MTSTVDNTMPCSEAEILLADLADGTLAGPDRRRLDLHLAGCEACSALARDIAAVTAFVEILEPVQPPAGLMNRILTETAGRRIEPRFQAAPGPIRSWWQAILEPVLQPRLAMGMAMTILSFSMVGRLAGIPQRQLTAEDLNPARVWSAVDTRVQRVWDRAVKHYENLLLVNQVRDRLREWSEQEERDARERRRPERLSTAEPDAGTPGATKGESIR
jgi:hypothetical protein